MIYHIVTNSIPMIYYIVTNSAPMIYYIVTNSVTLLCYSDTDSVTTWNTTLTEARVLKTLNDECAISYQVQTTVIGILPINLGPNV